MKIKPLLFALMLILLFPQKAYACGCGIAITDMKVFNALKETQAYLLIDVKDKGSYDEMPFFRFVSMDKPYNVTIVFPMDQIPYDVQGKKMPAVEFLSSYGLSEAENNIKKQDVMEIVKNVNGPLFLTSNGILPMIPLLFFSGTMGARAGGVETNALAHFEFEGGSLDIYNVSSAQTLDEFVNSLGINVTDKVKDLVTKYNNYFVAVLRLQVPSLISEDKMNYLESCAPDVLEGIQNELSQSSETSYNELQSMIYRYPNNFDEQGNEYLREYISAATYTSGAVNGTLVTMKFRNSNSFFYPTSIVNSYKYPIKDQKYYVKVPDSFHTRRFER